MAFSGIVKPLNSRRLGSEILFLFESLHEFRLAFRVELNVGVRWKKVCGNRWGVTLRRTGWP